MILLITLLSFNFSNKVDTEASIQKPLWSHGSGMTVMLQERVTKYGGEGLCRGEFWALQSPHSVLHEAMKIKAISFEHTNVISAVSSLRFIVKP